MTDGDFINQSRNPHPLFRTCLLFFILALAIRISVILIWSPPLVDDQLDYLKIATSLASGNGFKIDGVPDLLRAPAYPYLLSLISNLTSGDPYRLMTIIQSVLSALTCVFIFLLAFKTWGRKAGIVAGIIAIVAPDFILYNTYLLTEPLFMFFTVILIWCLLEAGDKTWGWIVSAILIGLGSLARPMLMSFFPLMLLWLIFQKKLKLYKILIIAVITIAVILPWMLRNYSVSESFIPITGTGGVNIWLGNSEVANGAFRWITEGNPFFNTNLCIGQRNAQCFAKAFNFIMQHPLQELRLLALKTIFFLIPAGDRYPIHCGIITPITMFIFTGAFFEFLVLGAASLAFSPARRGTSLHWVYILSIFLNVFIFFYLDRYRVMAYLTLIPLAAAGWVHFVGKGHRKRKILILAYVVAIQVALVIVAFILRPDFMDGYFKISDKLPF